MNIRKTHISPIVLYTIFFSLMFGLYYKLILADPMLNYDDKMLIEPIGHMKTLSEYWLSLVNGYIYDIQPIRDLSYFINLQLKKFLPFYSLHLTNVVIWAAICLIFKRILNFYSKNNSEKNLAWALTFMLAISPVATSSVAWLAGRKHLLSALFILIASYLIIKTVKLNIKILLALILLFLFSCFSHPINVLWPAWVVFFTYRTSFYKDSKKLWIVLVAILSFIALIVLYLNVTYYAGPYVYLTGGGKFDPETVNNLGLSLLALGRYFYLCIFSFDALPNTHYEGSWQNMAGLFLLPIFIFIIYKIKDHSTRYLSFSFLLFFFLPLITVTAKITTIFCSDTYLLTAALGLYIILFLNLKQISAKIIPYIVLYCAVLLYANTRYVKSFQSDLKLWEYSYHHEATTFSALNLAIYYTELKKFKEADALIHILKEWETTRSLELIIAALRNIYYNTDISIEERIVRLENITPQTALGDFYLSILYSNKNQSQKVRERLPEVLKSPSQFFLYFQGYGFEETFAVYLALCDKNKVPNCAEAIKQVKEFIKMPFWDEQKFLFYSNKNKKNLDHIQY